MAIPVSRVGALFAGDLDERCAVGLGHDMTGERHRDLAGHADANRLQGMRAEQPLDVGTIIALPTDGRIAQGRRREPHHRLLAGADAHVGGPDVPVAQDHEGRAERGVVPDQSGHAGQRSAPSGPAGSTLRRRAALVLMPASFSAARLPLIMSVRADFLFASSWASALLQFAAQLADALRRSGNSL